MEPQHPLSWLQEPGKIPAYRTLPALMITIDNTGPHLLSRRGAHP